MASETYGQDGLFVEDLARKEPEKKLSRKPGNGNARVYSAGKLKVPRFAIQERERTCLEIDFPVLPVNRLAHQEGNAGKPIYQMSKWWARRRSSVFRSLLLAAAIQAPASPDPARATKLVWEAYYKNHQPAGSFSHLHVLDPFMGGGTTLVEGARLGMQMHGMDLNPVAWLVVKNELAGSDPEQARAFFQALEGEVKPQIQPFYVTECPRGHRGRWINLQTDKPVEVDPLALSPVERTRYRWQGAEVIYTFWAKHAPCQATRCAGYRTPVFKTLVIAEKQLMTSYLALRCPTCQTSFDAELGETRMAPAVERVVMAGEQPFTEISQELAQAFNMYEKGPREERIVRCKTIAKLLPHEPALHCPHCGQFAALTLSETVQRHTRPSSRVLPKKSELHFKRKTVFMQLLIHPDWLKGTPATQDGALLGGYTGADPVATAAWYQARAENLVLIEVRGRVGQAQRKGSEEEEDQKIKTGEEEESTSFDLPADLVLVDGTPITLQQGTVPRQSTCTCQNCGRENNLLKAVRDSGETAPTMPYALQGYCPECDAQGYNYGGRFFKAPDAADLARMIAADAEWTARSQADLADFWPREQLPYAHMTHERQPLPQNGYTHWWKMFNPRQLLIHTQFLRAITIADPAKWPLDVREQALGAFQQYLRNQNMFCFWDMGYDKLVPSLSNNHFHPKQLIVENCVFHEFGRGNWKSTIDKVIEGLEWQKDPWEAAFKNGGDITEKLYPGDGIQRGQAQVFCGSSTELPMTDASMDLVITDPPFGDNIFYADLADFFYVWLRIPLLRWYTGQPEASYFELPATPKALEAITNRAEHPDTRSNEEKQQEGSRAPADEFYQSTLTACWTEAARVLKPGGTLAFTFHHSADEPWINVLESLFEAGFILVATYPIRSDETKGENAQFGSKKIEYDIIHVCRKRQEDPQEVYWSRMREWVRQEVSRLMKVMEDSYQKELSEADLRVILRGKALEYYSRAYRYVLDADHQPFSLRQALVGINNLLDDLLQPNDKSLPEISDEITRQFLRHFGDSRTMTRDEMHKTLRGSMIEAKDFIERGWLSGTQKTIYVPSIEERFQNLCKSGRRRDTIKHDLDQAHFLIGAAMAGSNIDIRKVLQEGKIPFHNDVEILLDWYARKSNEEAIREAAALAGQLFAAYRAQSIQKDQKGRKPDIQQQMLFE